MDRKAQMSRAIHDNLVHAINIRMILRIDMLA